ncbi:MAG: hypothetical protein RJB68_1006 [Pseudomonadota bacterium]|jgi:hypothetical protein
MALKLLMAAERQGLRDPLYAQLQDIDDTPLRTFIDMLVRTHVVHAKRRALEVQEAAMEMANRFEKTVAGLESHPLGVAAPTTEDALQWLLQREG